FIGVEPFVNSMQKLLSRIGETGASNIRVYNDDATQLLDWLPDGSLDQIALLSPAPWPRRNPWTRRFFSPPTLARFPL
ncbi:tRNA (guanosine(46)-N7)-methyltransferase TrmB, partial [Rhizobium ruizarguesonis]